MSAAGPLAELGRALAAASLVAAALGLAAGLLLALLRRLPPDWKAWIWWLVAARAIAELAGVPGLSLAVLPAPATLAAREAVVADLPATPVTIVLEEPPPAAATSTPARPDPGVRVASRGRSRPAIADPWAIAGSLWLAGLAASALVAARSAARWRAIVRRARPAAAPALDAAVARARADLGLRRPIDLRSSSEIGSPVVVGLRSPVVLLPLGAPMSAEETELVLFHELAHLRRLDRWRALVPALAARLFYFHPVVRFAAREFTLAAEAACDAEVVARRSAPADRYGRLLVRFAAGLPPATAVAWPFAAPNVRRRLDMLVHGSFDRRRLAYAVPLVLVAGLAIAVPVRLVAAAPEPPPAAPTAPDAPPEAPEAAATPPAVGRAPRAPRVERPPRLERAPIATPRPAAPVATPAPTPAAPIAWGAPAPPALAPTPMPRAFATAPSADAFAPLPEGFAPTPGPQAWAPAPMPDDLAPTPMPGTGVAFPDVSMAPMPGMAPMRPLPPMPPMAPLPPTPPMAPLPPMAPMGPDLDRAGVDWLVLVDERSRWVTDAPSREVRRAERLAEESGGPVLLVGRAGVALVTRDREAIAAVQALATALAERARDASLRAAAEARRAHRAAAGERDAARLERLAAAEAQRLGGLADEIRSLDVEVPDELAARWQALAAEMAALEHELAGLAREMAESSPAAAGELGLEPGERWRQRPEARVDELEARRELERRHREDAARAGEELGRLLDGLERDGRLAPVGESR